VKGLELPVNVLVIVAVAVIVLLGIVGLYFAGFLPGSKQIALVSAKNNACSELINRGCGTTNATSIYVNYDVNGDGSIDTQDTLLLLCSVNYGVDNTTTDNGETACKRNVCGCAI